MRIVIALCVMALSGITWSLAQEKKDDAPRALDDRLEVVCFAKNPDIVHPVGLAVDRRGRVLVIESHTHFRPEGYPDRPMVPHGMAVALTAPEAFRFTFDADPARHLRAAALLDPSVEPGPDAHAANTAPPDEDWQWLGHVRDGDGVWRPVALASSLARCWDALLCHPSHGDLLCIPTRPVPRGDQREVGT